MSKPVENWRDQIEDVSVFFDISDENLRFFGPRVSWRELRRKNVGQRKALFSGVVDFGYEQSELQALSARLPGKKILPLPISAVSQEPELAIEISSPHAGGLVALNTLPFPQYRLDVTVDLHAADADALIEAISDGWAKKNLLRGKYCASADGVVAKGGYKVIVDVKLCIEEILGDVGGSDLSIVKAWKAVFSAIQRQKSKWVDYYGGAESQGEYLLAEGALASILYERCFDQVTLMTYDNGVRSFAARLRDGATMGDAEARIFVSSGAAKVFVNIPF